jgi:hypothetical protein
VALVCETAYKIKIISIVLSFIVKEINELVITSNKVTNNFSGLVTVGLWLAVAHGPHCCK